MIISTIVTLFSLITVIKSNSFKKFTSVCGDNIVLVTNTSRIRENPVSSKSQCALECAFSNVKENYTCYGFNLYGIKDKMICEFLYEDDYFPTCDNIAFKSQGNIYVQQTTETCLTKLCKSYEKCVETLRGPNCETRYCEDPPTVMNSIITSGSNKLGTVRAYICNTLYFMTGKSTITCQKNETWTTPALVCHERCPISKGFRYREEEDICYKIIYQATPHDEAERECWRANSTLVTIRSKTTQDLVNADLHTNYSRFHGYHIDAIYNNASNVWIDKNGRKLIYTDWITDPVSATAVMNPCAIVVNTSKWSSKPCSVLALPVCEYGRCPKSYQIYPNLNLCYKIYNSHKLNRTAAQSECQESDGNLLVIDNDETQNFIESVDNNVTSIHVPKQHTGKTSYAYTLLTDYGYSVGTSTSITLKIKACNDAHVGLMPENDRHSTNIYEIAIGGWKGKKSVLRRQKQSNSPVDSYYSGRLMLSCSKFRKFTFSWTSGTIKVFEGDGTQILKYEDPNPYQVNFIGVTGGIWADVTIQIYTEEFYSISGQNINGTWMDDRDRIMNYFNWKFGQPDEDTGLIGISLYKKNSLGRECWFDDKQSQNHFFICEYPNV